MRSPVGTVTIQTRPLHRCPAAHLQHHIQCRFVIGHDDLSAMRNRAHQMMKLFLDRSQIIKNISMVKFKIV